jgi:hypothetical protein
MHAYLDNLKDDSAAGMFWRLKFAGFAGEV